ncbi:fungal-specific transcription factor domain-containing protein [Aspergillus insuetus]
MDLNSQSRPRRPRLKVRSACVTCRSRKAKCDGTRPGCTRPHLQRKHIIQTPTIHAGLGSHGRDVAPAAQYSRPTPPTSIGTPSNNGDSLAEPGDTEQDPKDLDRSPTYYGAHGRFAGQVVAAIDPAAKPHRVPFVDAPLFENLTLDTQPRSHFVTELPPRAHGDQLVDIYWRYVEPVEPVLDYERFRENYEKIYFTVDDPPCTRPDSSLWLCILNAVFALATQREEYVLAPQRNEQGNRFFLRAWALLPPDLLWRPISLELLQSLILVNRYLHCTDNQHKTWMTAGVVIRMAQSMCGHERESKDEELKLKVWATCVALDRCTSWSLGKPSTLVPLHFPLSSYQRSGATNAKRDSWGMRLYEIGNLIQFAQLRVRGTPSPASGMQSQQDEYCHAALQLDASLQQWEDSLPTEWQAQSLNMGRNRTSRAEGYLLQLRYLHHRIYLYRPMLAHIYSMASHPSPPRANPNLNHRLLQNAATMCLEAAQQIATLVIESLEQDQGQPIGLLPWWYRIYFLHIAGSNFLAAMINRELFTESVARSWEGVLAALHSHEHLCAYAAQCRRTFEALAGRLKRVAVGIGAGTCEGVVCGPSAATGVGVGALEPEGSPPGLSFDELFQDIDFDLANGFLFGDGDFINGIV